MLADRASIIISYNNKNITKDLAPYLKAFSYNDVMSGEADDISITLEDRKELWKSDWLPEKGAMLKAAINVTENNTKKQLDLGQFEIDEIESSGPPEEVKIKAVSVPNNSKLRGEAKNKSWEKTSLSVIAKDIAASSGMKLFYDTKENPKYDRVEQTEQSDLSFLTKLCNDAGLALKINDMQIIIFDEEKYEQQEAIATIEKGKSRLISYNIKSSLKEVYATCHVKYQETKQKKKIESTYKVEGKKGKTLEINEEVKSIGEAEKLAKKKLREKNKDEITVTLNVPGNIIYAAGLTLTLKSFGAFDGKYIITKVSHSIGSGYTASLELRRCLNGY